MQITGKPTLLTCLAVVLVIGFAACGVGNGAQSPAHGAGSGASSTATASKLTPAPTNTASTTSSSGQVTVTLGAIHYAPTDTITAAIHNGTASAISTTDHQTECKEITLQLLVSGTWQSQRQCPLLSPTRLVTFAPGVTPQPLSPGSAPWPAGTYRIAFAYFVGVDAGAGAASDIGQTPMQPQAQPIYSVVFTVG